MCDYSGVCRMLGREDGLVEGLKEGKIKGKQEERMHLVSILLKSMSVEEVYIALKDEVSKEEIQTKINEFAEEHEVEGRRIVVEDQDGNKTITKEYSPDTIIDLNKNHNITIIMITHDLDHDNLIGNREQMEVIAEYSTLGTFLGMLTDSRSFSSYVRFDFFRRILANLVGEYVERGEYDYSSAFKLVEDISYNNIKEFLNI